MTAPNYVPVPLADKARTGLAMPAAKRWTATRPGDLVGRQPTGAKLGRPGPDQGYGLKLARRLADRLELAPGEHLEDVVAGNLAVGLARASLFGRAPVTQDMELSYTLWGYLGGAPSDLVEYRKPLFSGAGHHYFDQRKLVDRVPESTLRMTPQQVKAKLGDWRTLVNVV